MEDEVKKWLEKKKREMGQPAHEREEKPVVEPKIEQEPEPQSEQPPIPVETAPVEIPEEVEEEAPITKHVETQTKIASDMDVLKMKETPVKTGGFFTTKAKIMLMLIIALVIFIIYWTFVYSPALLSTE
jgi:hypothetical protein